MFDAQISKRLACSILMLSVLSCGVPRYGDLRGDGQEGESSSGSSGSDPGPDVNAARIAFTSNRNGNLEIYVMSAVDGSSQKNLTNNDADDSDPAWSPDKTQIAFARGGDIYLMNAVDGSNQTKLTNDGMNGLPAWSPDGTKIAFARFGDIYVMNAADGFNQTRLTFPSSEFAEGLHDLGRNFDPVWSPHGTQIAFYSDLGNGNFDINLMDAVDGSNQTNISNNPTRDGSPTWSPDGTRIAFYSNSDGNGEIYVMNAADGSNRMNLTNDPAGDFDPAWSPDGTQIAFYSVRDGNFEIYVMNAVDGSNQTRLTNDPSDDTSPAWSP